MSSVRSTNGEKKNPDSGVLSLLAYDQISMEVSLAVLHFWPKYVSYVNYAERIEIIIKVIFFKK